MAEERVPPPGIDVTTPNIARVYDAFLGGKDNFAVDREVMALALRNVPDAKEHGKANRALLRRVVRLMVADYGIRQFIDIGSGLPTMGNVHEVAQEIEPKARIVYVDNDPMVAVHARALLGRNDATRFLTADLRHPDSIVGDPGMREFLDFDEPIGLLLFAILHHIGDDENPEGIMTTLRDALPSGSYVAISHFHNPGKERPEDAARAYASEKLFNEKFGTGRWRTKDEIRAYFGDFELLRPGLVPMWEWRPGPADSRIRTLTHHLTLGGVGRKQ
ncbi:SAM-dependent methyltransferase [Streptosporangiaceae bacterium NEAU-GS5]|nr:SAM-dependent methyltransferase [Streptosporangiaceae bacterium NEAU-GS5]